MGADIHLQLTVMEAKFALFVGLYYQLIPIGAFRIGITLSNNNKHSPLLQLTSGFHSRLLLKHFQNNKNKRFFEFNPVAFGKSVNKNNDERNFKFSPFMSSLESYRLFMDRKRKPSTIPSSDFTDDVQESDSIKPYVNHFTGIKPLFLHFSDNKDDEKARKTESEVTEVISPRDTTNLQVSDQQNFHTTEHSLGTLKTNDSITRPVHRETNSRRTNSEQETKDNEVFTGSFVTKSVTHYTSTRKSNSENDKISENDLSGRSFEVSGKANTGEGTGNIKDILKVKEVSGSRSPLLNLQSPKNSMEDLKESEAMYPYESLIFDEVFNDARSEENDIPKAHIIQKVERNEPLHLDRTENMQYLNDFNPNMDIYWPEYKTVSENKKPETSWGTFGSFHKDDTRSYRVDEAFTSDIGQFGGFATDNSACDDIESRACSFNTDCACYGFYHCNEGMCLSNKYLSAESSPSKDFLGKWHDDPVDLGTWTA